MNGCRQWGGKVQQSTEFPVGPSPQALMPPLLQVWKEAACRVTTVSSPTPCHHHSLTYGHGCKNVTLNRTPVQFTSKEGSSSSAGRCSGCINAFVLGIFWHEHHNTTGRLGGWPGEVCSAPTPPHTHPPQSTAAGIPTASPLSVQNTRTAQPTHCLPSGRAILIISRNGKVHCHTYQNSISHTTQAQVNT